MSDLPERKQINHRGPLSVNTTVARYFVTICSENHQPWTIRSLTNQDVAVGRRVLTPPPDTGFESAANTILNAARWYHEHGKWWLYLFLVMPDHIHMIVHFNSIGLTNCGGVGTRRPTSMESTVTQFKKYLSRNCGLSFQRDFWDTRLRNDEQFSENFWYIRNNPVRKGLCAAAEEWPYAIAFNGMTGREFQLGLHEPPHPTAAP